MQSKSKILCCALLPKCSVALYSATETQTTFSGNEGYVTPFFDIEKSAFIIFVLHFRAIYSLEMEILLYFTKQYFLSVQVALGVFEVFTKVLETPLQFRIKILAGNGIRSA